MTEDLDVNDDGLVDAIVPTRPCVNAQLTPPKPHGPHAYQLWGGPWWRCPGYKEVTP